MNAHTTRKVWAMHVSTDNENSLSLHTSERAALEDIASVYDIEIEGLTPEQIDRRLDRAGVWVTLQELEVPALCTAA